MSHEVREGCAESRLPSAVLRASGSPLEVHGARIAWGACRDAAPRSCIGAQLNAHATESAQGVRRIEAPRGMATHIVRIFPLPRSLEARIVCILRTSGARERRSFVLFYVSK